ncbi:16S rRNA (cytosine(967)-C(5))-methyltransferase [Aphanothece sacrum]|uniref:16S rRNA (cytosine(967)-C(5))-methyltransferase n=1 Tax=Aphanothece sacrum FPU1 TaxID=1920663 RepID=A0A401IBX4_APHSA|nr:16S rRNA (cytosine(967)-C(5))-methyltransferase [Aphanothece sacrum]GBF78749.1 Fmu, rRNA SAM-dependent methyltransferase [Aphanothece sacrum FPU1]GBF82981.1 rRNA SAM-dependent methyltransferase Fmu [Aphanothece sacrum FPU3]
MSITNNSITNARQLALQILRDIDRRKTYTDIALDRGLKQTFLSPNDRGLCTELVYGIIRRQRTLDTLIDQLGKKSSQQQPPDLRRILHLGLYQLRYLNHIPPSAAVNTSVELTKENQLTSLAGVVNGILRQYIRLNNSQNEPLILPNNLVEKLGIIYSFPDWIIKIWLQQFGQETTEKICHWFNQPPSIDIRINSLQSTLETVETKLIEANLNVTRLLDFPNTLRLTGKTGAIQTLPGFKEGWWTVQDSSAQLVSYLLDPQPGEIIIDACAAPGGKTTHIAELIQDKGLIWACDRTVSRLKKITENAQRLHLESIKILEGDSRNFEQFRNRADRVLLDVPCSGLGTLHRHPDIRWRQTPETVSELSTLQGELLEQAATWIKPQGILVYGTCTLNSLENESIIERFLNSNSHWKIEPPSPNSWVSEFASPSGWIQILPHQHHMDGFFMVKLKKD